MILGIDPGSKESGWCLYSNKIEASGVALNHEILLLPDTFDTVVIENPEARNQALGVYLLDTIYWSGFFSGWFKKKGLTVFTYKPSHIRNYICGRPNASDKDVTMRLSEKYDFYTGRKRKNETRVNMQSHAIQALAVIDYHLSKI